MINMNKKLHRRCQLKNKKKERGKKNERVGYYRIKVGTVARFMEK